MNLVPPGYPGIREGIVDVAAIPGEEEIHAVGRSQADVRGIRRGARWNQAGGENALGEQLRLVSRCQHPAFSERRQPQSGRLGISTLRFVEDIGGDIQVKRLPPLFPPFAGGNLLSGDLHVTVGPRCEQAGDVVSI